MGQQAPRSTQQSNNPNLLQGQEFKRRKLDGGRQVERREYEESETREFSQRSRGAKEEERGRERLKSAFYSDPRGGRDEEFGSARF